MAKMTDDEFSLDNIESLLSSIDGLVVTEMQDAPQPEADTPAQTMDASLEITAEKLYSVSSCSFNVVSNSSRV